MWSETMDSSTFFSKELPFRNETEGINNFYGAKSDIAASPYITSPYGLRGHSLMSTSFEHSDVDLMRDQRVNALLGTYTPRLDKPSNFDLLSGFRQNLGSASFFTEEDQVKISRALYENAPLSSSLSNSFSSGLRYSGKNISSFPSVGADDHHEEKEPFESLKELEAKTIGNLLPDDDDDDLFCGVADSIDQKNRPTSRDEIVDGFFIRVGELEIGEDGQKRPEALEGNHPLCEYPSRTLFVRNINNNIQDTELHALFGQYGDISSLCTTCKRRGFVIVSYYDIRAACNAMKALRDKPMQHRKLDIHFSIPKENPSNKGANQGILAVFNLDSSVSNDELRQIFAVYGEVKEIRETAHRSHHKFIEFYDVRAANAAVRALNRTDIAGKIIKVEPIPLGGITSNSDTGTFMSARCTGRPPMSPYRENLFHNGLPTVINLESVNNQSNSMERSNPHGQSKFEIWGTPNFHSGSRPDYQDGFANGNIRNSPGNGNCRSPGQQQMWSSSPRSQPQSMTFPNSPSFINGKCSPCPQQVHAIVRPPSHFPSGVFQMNNHPIGSAPSAHPSLWERRHGYSQESSDTSAFNSGSLHGLSILGNFPHAMELIPHNVFHSMEPNVQLHPQNQQFLMVPTRGRLSPLLSPLLSPFTSPTERTRSRRNDRSLNQDKKQFELDVDRIMNGEDKRTTLMIKNIPNKYTSKMLLVALDEHHKGTYDFLYLPIDFKNKCNVGYSFINMIEPSLIVPLYQELNGEKWEKFNSEKVASIAYARIQGKAALVAHFENSSLMSEDKRCRPILFHSDGPNAGNQVPFPIGRNIRSKPRTPSTSSSENIQEGRQDSETGEEFSCGKSGLENSYC